ncbi:MAG: hypothetical protein EU529_15155 [Promethearchaeota archaeon]|nr:MAG: hypothetical protein EU529_15155 [Candidatus Lokiarchaeota archaeon]
MTDKSIDISEEVYNKIKDLKHKDESLSNYILRLIDKEKGKNLIEEFTGLFEKDSEEWEEIEKYLYKSRLKNIN